MSSRENLLHGIERASANITKHYAQSGKRHGRQSGFLGVIIIH
jgi:hypothetical protein